MKIEKVTKDTREKLFAELYETSAMTFEGTTTDEVNLKHLENFIRDMDARTGELDLVIYTGVDMNEYYHLTGTNAYSDDLTFVSARVSCYNAAKVALPMRFMLGGRWFDDIVDNNARREEEKRHEV